MCVCLCGCVLVDKQNVIYYKRPRGAGQVEPGTFARRRLWGNVLRLELSPTAARTWLEPESSLLLAAKDKCLSVCLSIRPSVCLSVCGAAPCRLLDNGNGCAKMMMMSLFEVAFLVVVCLPACLPCCEGGAGGIGEGSHTCRQMVQHFGLPVAVLLSSLWPCKRCVYLLYFLLLKKRRGSGRRSSGRVSKARK